jgi:hypothetical protein
VPVRTLDWEGSLVLTFSWYDNSLRNFRGAALSAWFGWLLPPPTSDIHAKASTGNLPDPTLQHLWRGLLLPTQCRDAQMPSWFPWLVVWGMSRLEMKGG